MMSDMNTTRIQRRMLKKQNARLPTALQMVPQSEWPSKPRDLINVWRSRDHLVQQYLEDGVFRISVCRTTVSGERWNDGISWDELQSIKSEVGFGHLWAVECFPPDDDLVNVANMRHLWLLTGRPEFGWEAA